MAHYHPRKRNDAGENPTRLWVLARMLRDVLLQAKPRVFYQPSDEFQLLEFDYLESSELRFVDSLSVGVYGFLIGF